MDEQRAEFEAFVMQETGISLRGNVEAMTPGIGLAWRAWQAATQRQQERIAELEAQVQALSLDAGRIDALVHALAKYDWRSSSIWRYYYPSVTGTYIKIEDFRDGLAKIISNAGTAIAAGKGEG